MTSVSNQISRKDVTKDDICWNLVIRLQVSYEYYTSLISSRQLWSGLGKPELRFLWHFLLYGEMLMWALLPHSHMHPMRPV